MVRIRETIDPRRGSLTVSTTPISGSSTSWRDGAGCNPWRRGMPASGRAHDTAGSGPARRDGMARAEPLCGRQRRRADGSEASSRRLGWRVGRTAGLASIWTSNLTRAQRTAAACEESTGLRAQIDSRVRELDFGSAEGLTMDEIRERFAPAAAAISTRPGRAPPPRWRGPGRGGEAVHRVPRDICEPTRTAGYWSWHIRQSCAWRCAR